MNPPMEPGEAARIDDLVRRVERAELAADVEHAATLTRERDHNHAIEQRQKEVLAVVAELRDSVDDLKDGAARRRDVITLACAAIAPTLGLIGVLFATRGG